MRGWRRAEIKEVSAAARLLGERGAKGGRARAAALTPEETATDGLQRGQRALGAAEDPERRYRTMLNVMPIEGIATTNDVRNDSTQPRRRQSRPAAPVG